MTKQTHFLKQGFAQIELSDKLKLTFSRPVTKSVIIEIYPATDEEPVRRSQQKLARMWAADMAKQGKGALNLADDCYGWFKGQFLAPFIIQHDAELAERFQEVKKLKSATNPQTFAFMCDQILSTSMFSCAEVSEALRNWQAFMNEYHINYRDPADYQAALQVEWYAKEVANEARNQTEKAV